MAPSATAVDFDRTTVCERFTPLVKKTISGLNIPQALREDAEQEGMIGLLKAFDRYDTQSPVHFSLFARPYVRGAIIRGVMPRDNALPTTPVGDAVDLDVLGREPVDQTIDVIENVELLAWLDSLAPTDSWLVWSLYWQGATSIEVASDLNRTVHWVNERHRILIGRAQSILGAI